MGMRESQQTTNRKTFTYINTMPNYRLKFCKLRTSVKFLCICFASFVSLLLLNSVFKSIHTLSKSIQIESAFIETALSANEIPLEKLPISSMRKAILHLTENYKKEEHCTTCNKVQQKLSERTITANILDKKGPCNFLIFGLGFDSIMWTAMNPGRTVFLEDDKLWAERMRKTAPFLEIYTVNYPVRKREYPRSLERFQNHKDCNPAGSTAGCFLMLALPQKLLDMSWDIIMVDAPNGGGGDNSSTRQMSIFTAAILARRSSAGAHVLVHDVHREIEDVFSDKFLCSENLVEALERSARLFSGSRLALRHYYIQHSDSYKFCKK